MLYFSNTQIKLIQSHSIASPLFHLFIYLPYQVPNDPLPQSSKAFDTVIIDTMNRCRSDEDSVAVDVVIPYIKRIGSSLSSLSCPRLN